MQIFVGFLFIILINIAYVRSSDAFPSAVVQKRDFVAIDTIEFIAIRVHCVPIFALFYKEIAIPEHIGTFFGITLNLTAGTMVDIPVTGTALEGHITKWEIIDLFSIYSIHQIAVFISEIPGCASFDAVITVVQQVDLIAVEDGTATSVDVYSAAGSLDVTAIP